MSFAVLAEFLLRTYPFTPQQLAFIGSQATEKTYRAGEFFSEAGRTAHEIGFVVRGVFRVSYFDKDANDLTKYFIDEQNFLLDLHSYQYQLPSAEYIQAVTDAQLLVFKASRWQTLAHTIADWPSIESTLIARALLEKVQRLRPLVSGTATARYQHFLEKFPTLANRVPLAYVASYLGITPQSLSRIRRQQARAGRSPNRPTN